MRGPGTAVAPSPARSSYTAVAAASAGGRSAVGRLQVPELSDPAGDVTRMLAGCVRSAGSARGAGAVAQPLGSGGQRRHRQGIAVRPELALQLDRRVHV